MRIVISGFERAIQVERGRVSTLSIDNPRLFSRICQSLISEEGEYALEPYSLWDGDLRIKPKDAIVVVVNPFDLPWGHRLIGAKLYSRFESLYLEDEETRRMLEGLSESLNERIAYYGMELTSDYCFNTDWNVSKYLKAFSFGVDHDESDTLIDSIIKFMELYADVECDAALAFVNIRKFLSEDERKTLVEQCFILNLPVLLMESGKCEDVFENEDVYTVDQDFLESSFERPVSESASLQEEICSKGFGAVTI